MAFLTFCGVKKVDSCVVSHVDGEEEVAPGYHIGPLHIHATTEVRSLVWKVASLLLPYEVLNGCSCLFVCINAPSYFTLQASPCITKFLIIPTIVYYSTN